MFILIADFKIMTQKSVLQFVLLLYLLRHQTKTWDKTLKIFRHREYSCIFTKQDMVIRLTLSLTLISLRLLIVSWIERHFSSLWYLFPIHESPSKLSIPLFFKWRCMSFTRKPTEMQYSPHSHPSNHAIMCHAVLPLCLSVHLCIIE